MTLEELEKSGNIIFKCISGSRAYGLETSTSDTDIRGVFILPKEQFYSLEYIGQINNETNDIAYYELRKFIELCLKNNPNILEMLNVSQDCVLYKDSLFDKIKKELFLSKLCEKTFANYAFTQIKKARGLHKKIVNPVEKERKSIEDFCTIRNIKESMSLSRFLKENNLDASKCGLAKVPNMKNCFNVFYSEKLNYQGIARENANEVCTSSIPKEEQPVALLYCNLEGYSSYCKKYKEYWIWVSRRNEERYKSNVSHDKNYDAKNMMHTFRLLHFAEGITKDKNITVRVGKEERDYLLSIKNAHFDYDELVSKAEKIKERLSILYDNSSLPEKPDVKKANDLLFFIRASFYKKNRIKK